MIDTQRARTLELLRIHPLMRLKEFAVHGIAPETLARLVRDEFVVRPARGLYQLADAPVDARHALAEASALVPAGIVSLISALQFHGLTLQTPSAIWLAIDRTAWRPTIQYPPTRFVRFSGWARTAGIERQCIDGVAVALTDPARTIVDCFRYRTKVGIDVAIEGLREGLRQRRATIDQLWRYGKEARVWATMKPYVEALIADGT